MIWAFNAQINDHAANSATFVISAPDRGIFVRELEVYLGNCQDCSKVGLSYTMFFLPIYADNDTQTGVDAFLLFNNPVSFSAEQNKTAE